MSNPIYDQTQQNNIMGQFNNFMQNPGQFLMQRHINLPQQYQNNPKEAVQYLMNNGQMSQDSFNRIMNVAQKMGVKLN